MSEHPNPLAEQQIASRAREIWEEEGQPEGRAEEHWARAENELRERLAGLAAATAPPTVPVVTGLS